MAKKSYKQFFFGKEISKQVNGSKPMRWIPNTYVDTYNIETGKFKARRKYGKDGWAYKDMDTADEIHPYDHIHDIKNGQRLKNHRKPNTPEKVELNKAKKKRRFF